MSITGSTSPIKISTPNATQGYKDEVFYIWHSSGKPPSRNLHRMIPGNPLSNDVPAATTLAKWIKNDFIPKAEKLDEAIWEAMQHRLTNEKIAMMDRHAKTGMVMQEMALNYLEENSEKLRVSNAIRLLIDGIRIERESAGIPRALEKMAKSSDEQLMKELESIIKDSSITSIEPVEN